MDPCAAHYFSGAGDWLVILAAVILAAMIVGLYIGWNVMKALDDGGWLLRWGEARSWLVILAAVILAAMIVGLFGWNVMKALDDGGLA